jgi:hypothetical protein
MKITLILFAIVSMALASDRKMSRFGERIKRFVDKIDTAIEKVEKQIDET